MARAICCCICKERLYDFNPPHARWVQPKYSEMIWLARMMYYRTPAGWAHTACADDADFWRVFLLRFLVSEATT